jgi:hypothetical protein
MITTWRVGVPLAALMTAGELAGMPLSKARYFLAASSPRYAHRTRTPATR